MLFAAVAVAGKVIGGPRDGVAHREDPQGGNQLLKLRNAAYGPAEIGLVTQATAMEATAKKTAPCPKCATIMVLAAITRHPIVAHMERHTFLCVTCNQTKTYMLSLSAK